MKKIVFLFIAGSMIAFSSGAQVRQIPEQVKYAFSKQYASAENVDYKDYLVGVEVHFTVNDTHMIAKYDNKGNWKETEKAYSFDELNPEVKDGFNKSKYSDWKVEETSIIIAPETDDKYRIKVGRSDIQKKYLYFDKEGRLIKDSITI